MKSLTCKQSSASHLRDGAFSTTQCLSNGLHGNKKKETQNELMRDTKKIHEKNRKEFLFATFAI